MTDEIPKTEIEDPLIERKDFVSFALQLNKVAALPIFVCPFCFSVFAPPINIVFTPAFKCSCGALFHQLGHASRPKIRLVH